MYIVSANEPPEKRAPNLDRPDKIYQVMVGQFPLSYNVTTGVFALGGSRLTAKQWVELRLAVDSFLDHHHLLDKYEVHDFRPSLSKRASGAVRWLTRR